VGQTHQPRGPGLVQPRRQTYKNVVKLTFHKGASLDDPAGLFNSSLAGNVRRAIDITQGDEIDEEALTNIVRQAVALNLAR
jgi:hypothetical protein